MAKKIQVSFKETEEDLYQYILSHSNYSGHIKDCIRYYIQDKKEKTSLPFDPINDFKIKEWT